MTSQTTVSPLLPSSLGRFAHGGESSRGSTTTRAVVIRVVAVYVPHTVMATAMLAMLFGRDAGGPPILMALVLGAVGAFALLDRQNRTHAAQRAIGLLLAAMMQLGAGSETTTDSHTPVTAHGHEAGIVFSVGLTVGIAYLALTVATAKADAAAGESLARRLLALVMPAAMIAMLVLIAWPA